MLQGQAGRGLPRLDLQARHLQRSRRRRRRSVSREGQVTTIPDRNGYALVTGAGARLGSALARRLAADGWAVAIHYRNSAKGAEALAQEIKAAGGRAVTVGGDL